MSLTHMSLFTGIGGIDLAAEWAGFESIGQCEMADYPTKVLEKHWPDVPRWRDVHDITADSFRERTGLSTVDLVSGGYPCQTFSVAGKRTGDLSLAKQLIRVATELRATWVIGENVGGHIGNGLDEVIGMLAAKGYKTRPFVLQAKAVGAPHKRERVFIVGYTQEFGRNETSASESGQHQSKWEKQIRGSSSIENQQCSNTDTPRPKKRHIPTQSVKPGFGCGICNAELAHACKIPNAQACKGLGTFGSRFNPRNYVSGSHWRTEHEPDWTVSKSELVRMADGLSNGMDALGCSGNAVVPWQVYPILKAIADIERSAR